MSMMTSVSSYTFDPLNNSWKPSANRKSNNRSHHSSSSASSYSYSPAEPVPSTGVQFTYDEEDIVRHHYTAWGVGDNGIDDANDPAFLSKQTLVEIQYNKRTGEISLLDEDGVVTPEEYKRLMKAVKYSHENDEYSNCGIPASQQRLQSQEREQDVAVGTTLFLDPEDLDPTDIIDTEGQDIATEDYAYSSPTASTERSGETQHYAQQLQDCPDLSTKYQSEAVSSPFSNDSFNSCSLPAPSLENNYPVPHYQHYQHSQQPLQSTSAGAEPILDDSFQQEKPLDYQCTEYYTTALSDQVSTSVNDETMEEGYEDEATYQSTRGFGFAHRRDFFTGSH
eukprot:CAMPEP_0197187260 /NCGR_PEP_ID=MMETSP1423-20130617/15562_1 /TAXON_ID=476441 /ORGANISM="Pseudo-nitzschia heimii, Strain UNC1101" /LENGTH=336 /DNA_ID=CAMNT_0042638801 /DNA_START=163 /DNA_END=1173 /DNA_ORIENTATION=+